MLFLTSVVLIFISSYLLSSILECKEFAKGFIYTVLIGFSQIIFTTEILSIFHQFKPIPFLILNIIGFIVITFIWLKNNKPLYKPEFRHFINKIKNSVLRDKSLILFGLAWIFFITVSLFLCIISPVTNGDAKIYHIVRSAYWVLNSSINHFDTANIRNVIFPVNSEIVYAWIILFTKKALLLGLLTFTFYCVYITSLYQIVHKIFGYSLRRTLWVIFTISSFACMVIQISSVQTDLVIASLILIGIYLLWDSFICKNKVSLFMSSLSFALAIGTKSSAGFLIFASVILLVYLAKQYKNYKSILYFIVFAVINFLIFSSYNYILNFVEFGNIFGYEGAIRAHKNLYGISGFFANAIKYFFLFFDFTGFNLQHLFEQTLLNTKDLVLQGLNLSQIPDGIYTDSVNELNNTLSESSSGCGLLGFLLFLPCLVLSIIKPIFKQNRKNINILIFGLFFIISFFTLSYTMSFMTYNIRYLNSIIFVSAPIIAISYIKSNKNIFKHLIILISIFYLTCVSTHIWSKPLNKILPEFIKSKATLSQVQYTLDCINWNTRQPNHDDMCKLEALIDYNFNDRNNKILFFANSSEFTLRFAISNINGSHFDIKRIEDINSIDVNKYNILVIPTEYQHLTYIKTGENKDTSNLFKCIYLDINNNVVEKDTKPCNEYCQILGDFYKKYELGPVTTVGKYLFFVNKKNLPRTNRIN